MMSLQSQLQRFVFAFGALTCFIIISDYPVAAQSVNPRLNGALRSAERMPRQKEVYESDKRQRELEREIARAHEGRPAQPDNRKNAADALQAKQDFEKIQNNYNRLVLAMASKDGLQRDTVLADVAEIKKAATRLKTKLALPISANTEQKPSNTADTAGLSFPEWVRKLQQHIYDFLTNPLFDTPRSYKVDEAKRASGDLEKVIKVSDAIMKQPGGR